MQTALDNPMIIGRTGQLADAQATIDGDVVPGTNEESTNSIPFGCLATSSSAEGAKLPVALADVQNAKGVLVLEDIFDVTTQLSQVNVNNTVAVDAIKPGVTGSFLRKGRIYVVPEASGTEASAVRVRIVAGAGNNVTVGSWTPTADVGKTVSLGAAARWRGGGPTANTPSIVEIDATNFGLATAD